MGKSLEGVGIWCLLFAKHFEMKLVSESSVHGMDELIMAGGTCHDPQETQMVA